MINFGNLNLNPNYKTAAGYEFVKSEGFTPLREREIESILSMSNGYMGTRNSLEEGYNISDPATFVAGIYEKVCMEDYNELVKMPDWTRIHIFIDGNKIDLVKNRFFEHTRYIDIQNCLSIRNWINIDTVGRITDIKIIKFISLFNKHEAGKCIIVRPENYSGKIKILSGIDGKDIDATQLRPQLITSEGLTTFILKTVNSNKTVAMTQKSQFYHDNKEIKIFEDEEINLKYQSPIEKIQVYEEWEWDAQLSNTYVISSLVSVFTSNDSNNPTQSSRDLLRGEKGNLFLRSLQKHSTYFNKRWKNAEAKINGDLNAQISLNFALYQLISVGEFSGVSTSIPARGLSGEAYKGHVFWDTEMFLIPFYIFTNPLLARDLILYRYNTLAQAKENAKKENLKGASFAWESTDTGEEMTPAQVVLPNGDIIYINSGKYENHISPDIAYTVWLYWTATKDEEFMKDFGAELIFETCRFGYSLLTIGDDGLLHILKIIGPDEYHEEVDDNAYTNIMVQYNLEIAIKTYHWLKDNHQNSYELLKAKINLTDEEFHLWETSVNKIYTGFNEETNIFEQFKGFSNLESINLKKYEPRSAPMDVMLGKERMMTSQIVKQADVVMFLYLLSNKFSTEIIKANYNYYEPKTSHGSSLSPSIHSIVAARLGDTHLGYKYFTQNAQIDLSDCMGNASGGVHIAAVGGTWLALVMGFGGMYICDEGLRFDPHLPDIWDDIQFTLNWRKERINVKISHSEMSFETFGNENINLCVGDNNWNTLYPNSFYTAEKSDKWQWK